MIIILCILLSLFVLWVLSFCYNIHYFFSSNDSELDTVFINNSKTFEEASLKLNILEKYVGRQLKKPKKILKYYENNARKTNRKYQYYASYIEPSFVKIFINKKKGSTFKICWSLLDKPIKYHYINIYIFLTLIVIIVTVILIDSYGFYSILIILFWVGLLLRLYNYIIQLNLIFFYILLDGILILFKQDRGKLMKNVALLDLMTKSWFGAKRNNAYVIGAVGVSMYDGFGGGSGFDGFGGGSFGGGGAGGSW